MRALGAVIVAVALAACASRGEPLKVPEHLKLEELAASNQGKLIQLSVGMSRNDAIALMGNQTARTSDGIVNNPWTVETSVGKDGTQYEALYYVTRKNPPFMPVRKSLTTAIIIKDGKVVGWGDDALQRYK